MSAKTNPTLQDRLSQASEKKKTMLAKFKKAINPDDPATIENRRQREAIAAARSERATQREAARLQHEHKLAKQAAIDAEAVVEAKRAAAEQAAREAAEVAEREAALKGEQKAARDVRYAARKAAKKERRRGY
jgi:Family of unknown function (DUF6481)